MAIYLILRKGCNLFVILVSEKLIYNLIFALKWEISISKPTMHNVPKSMHSNSPVASSELHFFALVSTTVRSLRLNHTCMACIVESSFIAFKAGICTKKEKTKDFDSYWHHYVEATSGGETSIYNDDEVGHARTTDRRDKILSRLQWFSHVTRGDLLQQPVTATCRSDLSHIVCLGLYG